MMQPTLAWEPLNDEQYQEVAQRLIELKVDWYFVHDPKVTTYGVIVISTYNVEDVLKMLSEPRPRL